MSIQLKTPPANEPVSLSEAKSYLRITDTDDDTLIGWLITATRQQAEEWTGRALVTQTWALWLDQFPRTESKKAPQEGFFQLPVDHFDQVERVMDIPRPPLQSVTHLKTYDTGNTASTFDASSYIIDTQATPGRIALNQGSSWPANLRAVNAVEVEFVAGYGPAADVPEAIKQGMLLWIKQLFANKSKLFESDESSPGLLQLNRDMIPIPAMSMWMPYKVVKF